ncbi:MAG: HPr family phosphocarrier protein [Myxococcota bacterium]
MEAKFSVEGELGLHARPAGRFVTLAGRFESEIWVARDGDEEWVSGQSVLSILSLAASQGTILRLRAEGPDAEEALRALGALLAEPTQTV